MPNNQARKNREMDGAMAFSGRQSMKIPNDQLIVGSSGRIEVGKEACERQIEQRKKKNKSHWP
jgi:hypothetical protein